MPAQLELFEADGATPLVFHDWARVDPGAQSAPHVIVVKNTGDAPANSARLTVGVVGGDDLEGWLTVTVAGQAYTAAAPLGTIAAGASVQATVQATVPEAAEASTQPVSALLLAKWT